ncbi:SDR family oxidoreductase [Shewanella algidipiscicola]|uniref:Pteridine reductase n=1 Tax=Shewanella algidipiscicola TaxID=614070 RepID=A0ABQ4PN80_9GAMM|nr:SDR family oxidoreductase [Shewanella algidipiscicola]GIU49861.1 pteridine reductase [Shewanella algidipiscicola]
MNNWVLITGGAQRIGRAVALHLHQLGYNIALHYSRSSYDATAVCDQLNATRTNSCRLFHADLSQAQEIEHLIDQVSQQCPALKVVINNASLFTADNSIVGHSALTRLLSVNLMAPYLIVQGLKRILTDNQGCVINLIDIHADRPLLGHGLYSMSKAALKMATYSLAQELGAKVRVNGVSPGAILWPEQANDAAQEQVLKQIPLRRCGTVDDIAHAVNFLIDAHYITGQVIAVDGGRSATGYQGADG